MRAGEWVNNRRSKPVERRQSSEKNEFKNVSQRVCRLFVVCDSLVDSKAPSRIDTRLHGVIRSQV